MIWKINYLPEADDDMANLDGSQRLLVRKAIAKVSKNPVSNLEGGYGKPLGKKGTTNLTGFMKIKLKDSGLRIVYQLRRINGEMLVVIVGARADDEVYDAAEQRIERHSLE